MPLSRFELPSPEREYLEESDGLLHLFVAIHVLDDCLSLTVLGNDQGLSPVAAQTLNLGGMRLEKADGLDPWERLMVDPALRTKQSLTSREHETPSFATAGNHDGPAEVNEREI